MVVSASHRTEIFVRKLGRSWELVLSWRRPSQETFPKHGAETGGFVRFVSLQYNSLIKNLGQIQMSPPPRIAARQAAALLIGMSMSGVAFPWPSTLSVATVRADEGVNSRSTTPAQKSALPASRFSDAVVAKADKILLNIGLRRSGNSLQCTEAAELSRLLSDLARSRRELRLQQQVLTASQGKLTAFENELDQLQRQDGQLNLELARIAGLDVAKNNRIVALINATRSQIGQLHKQRAAHEKDLQAMRAQVNTAEHQYAGSVFQVRKRCDALEQTINTHLQDGQVRIALDVVHANFAVPVEIDADQIIRAVESRLRDFEKEVFHEKITLESSHSGALFTMVSVNQQSVRMIVDSGATLTTLPADAAAELQVIVPDNAPIIRMQLANGQQISGRRIVLASVRVGQFEAKDVDAVVLEPIAQRAEPLLGLSYLDRYKFELDSSGKTLGLLRVDESEGTIAKNR